MSHHGKPEKRIASRPAQTAIRLGVPLLSVLVLGVLAGIGFAAIIDVPRIEGLSDYSPSLITEILDSEGQPFASYAKERRLLLAEGNVPLVFQQALLAGEDRNFFQHGGVDAEGVLRALSKNILQGRFIGGSTITMQLARKLFLHPKKLWRRKIEEAFLAVDLEKRLSKEQILTLYSNIMFFGHGNYGVEAASRSYFGKPASELESHEAAALVGILQRPSDYSPYRRPDLVLSRRDYVLRRMLEEGYLDSRQYQEAVDKPLQVASRGSSHQIAPYLAEDVRKDIEQRLGASALLEQGLRVYTTLDQEIQRAAELAVQRGLAQLDRRLRGWRGPIRNLTSEDLDDLFASTGSSVDLDSGRWYEGVVLDVDSSGADIRIEGQTLRLDRDGYRWTGRERASTILARGDVVWVSPRREGGDEEEEEVRLELQQEPELEGAAIVLESSSGAVRAMVGGWDFERSKFNRATQARRQVGSGFKPFVFGAALEAGFTAADTLFDAPTPFPAETEELTYSPRNYYRDYNGITTLRKALERSMNVTSVKLIDLVGVASVIDLAHRAGIESPLPEVPSLALGSADLVPLEVAAAYAAIANQGVYVEPYLIEEIREPSGRVVEAHRTSARKAMDPQIAYVLAHILEGVIDRGTGVSASHLEIDLAGKTGTTDDYSDAWFIGFSPHYTMLVWVGHDVKRPIGRNMSGATAALPIWIDLVEQGLAQGWLVAQEEFVPPPGVTSQLVEYETGLLATPGSGRTVEEAFVEGTEPVLTYDAKWSRIVSLPWYQQRPFYIPKAGERMPEDLDDWTPIIESWADKREDRS
jgi:penicillin-binding protein 1A